jgi:hypothetical protein
VKGHTEKRRKGWISKPDDLFSFADSVINFSHAYGALTCSSHFNGRDMKRIKHQSGQKPCFFFLKLCLFVFLAVPRAGSQTLPNSGPPSPAERTPATDIPVAVMAFQGTNVIQSRQLYDAVIREARRLEGYTSRPLSFVESPNDPGLPPDRAPGPAFLGAAQYVLTGEYYIDNEDVWHLQLWLWDSSNGSLVYTDEEIAENMAEAEGYLPTLLSWILSHIPAEQEISPPDTRPPARQTGSPERQRISPPETASGEAKEEDSPAFTMGLYLGLRGGGSFNVYSLPRISGGYESNIGQSFTNEAAFFAEFQVLRFLSLQGEVVLTPDFLRLSKLVPNDEGDNIRVTDDFSSMSLMFPFLIKTPFRMGIFASSLYAGAYLTMPLGNTKMKNGDPAGSGGSYSFGITQYFGILLGLDMGVSLGPGELLLDLRYSKDFGLTRIQVTPELPYIRSRISLSAGYKFRLWKRS